MNKILSLQKMNSEITANEERQAHITFGCQVIG